MGTGIDAVAKVVGDGQVLQLQAVILRPEDRGAHHADGGGGFALAAVEHIPRRFARHVFTTRIDQTTPGVAIHFRINGFADFYVNRFIAGTIQSQGARRRRNVDGARVFARHDGDKQATVRVAGNCRIHRCLDGGMGHALGSRRADDKVRLRRQADGGRRPGRGIGVQRLEIGRRDKVFRFIGVQNGTRGGARCSLR